MHTFVCLLHLVQKLYILNDLNFTFTVAGKYVIHNKT